MPEPLVSEAQGSVADLARAVDRAVEDVRGMPIDHRKRALALQDAIEAFHKAGLTTIVRALKADPRGKELLFALVDDAVVHAMFAMHGIVRPDLRTRVARALEAVRPYTQSHGGDVELVDVREDTVFVRLTGACNGCSMSSVTLRNGVEESLRESCPEIAHIEVVPNEPVQDEGLVSLKRADPAGGWVDGPTLDEVHPGRPWRLELPGGSSLVLIRLATGVQAFRNACAHLGLPIDGGTVDLEAQTITCPWHGFRFDCQTGECLTAPQAQLEQVPVRVDGGRIRVRPA